MTQGCDEVKSFGVFPGKKNIRIFLAPMIDFDIPKVYDTLCQEDMTKEVTMETSAKASVREISVSGGCRFTIENGDDGKLVISVDFDSIMDTLDEFVSCEYISEEDVEYISDQMSKGEVTVI
jgi:hypothetical protein